jgi:KaiC/GvpD/RAD55 family RecA-like ATPase
MLVAAFALRDPEFAEVNAPLLQKVGSDFFGHFALRDIVSHGLEVYRQGHKLLPLAALKADMVRVGRTGVARDTYEAFLDRVAEVPLEGRDHVQETIVERVKETIILNTDPKVYVVSGQYQAYLDKLKEVDSLGVGTRLQSIVGVVEDLDTLDLSQASGIPIGFGRLDAAFNGGGVCGGELCVVMGRYNVGKTQLMHQAVVNVAGSGLGAVLAISHETSLRNTRVRILKTCLGWTDDMIRDMPDTFRALANKELANMPIGIKYAAGSDYNFAKMTQDVRRVEDKFGMPVVLVVRDYGELMASDPDDYRSVRTSYKHFKDFLGQHCMAGMDACQKNRQGEISHFNILKDADILLDLDLAGNSDRTLLCRIVRNREGPAGVATMILANRATGQMQEQAMTVDEGGPDEGDEAP